MWKAGSSQDKKFENPPAGTYGAICYRIIDLGTQKIEWQGDTKFQQKVLIAWELDEKMEDGRPFVISRRFSVSMHLKSSLRGFLKGWRGRDFTDEELQGFNPQKLIGAPCMLTLVQSGDYVNVASASKLPKGMTPLVLTNPSVFFSLDQFDQQVFDGLSNKIKETIQQSPEYQNIKGSAKDDLANDLPF